MGNIQKDQSSWKIVLAFIALYLVWGSTYLAVLFAVKTIPPFLLSGIRFLLAGMLLAAWSFRKGIPGDLSLHFGRNVLYGILMLFGGTVSVAWSEQFIPSSLAAIIVTALPFWIVLLDRKQWTWYFTRWSIPAGIVIGFIGVSLLLGMDKKMGPQSSGQWAAVLALVAGGISWAGGSLLSKYRPAGNSVTINAAVQLLAAGLFSSLVGGAAGEWKHFSASQVSAQSLFAFAYLVMMGSVLAYFCFLWLLQVKPAAQVSTYVYVNPVVAVLLGMLLAGERISALQGMALIIILAGVLLVNLPAYSQLQKIKK